MAALLEVSMRKEAVSCGPASGGMVMRMLGLRGRKGPIYASKMDIDVQLQSSSLEEVEEDAEGMRDRFAAWMPCDA